MSQMQTSRTVKCPRCHKWTPYSAENLFRPFCSERCKMIDLGQWANEDYRIASEKRVDLDAELSETLQNSDDVD